MIATIKKWQLHQHESRNTARLFDAPKTGSYATRKQADATRIRLENT